MKSDKNTILSDFWGVNRIICPFRRIAKNCIVEISTFAPERVEEQDSTFFKGLFGLIVKAVEPALYESRFFFCLPAWQAKTLQMKSDKMDISSIFPL
jgi:hypothetical protein